MTRGFRDDDHWPRRDDDRAQRSDLCDIAVELVHETPLAWLVNDGRVEVWIPKSLAELSGGVLTIPARLGLQKGLI